MMPIIEIKNVSVTVDGQKVLQDISFGIKEGEYLGIIGPNGGGKTTLLRAILGLVKTDTGTIKIFGQSVKTLQEKSMIGYVPQRVTQSVFIDFPVTVEEVVKSGLTPKIRLGNLFSRITTEDKQSIEQAMEVADIKHLRKKQIKALSGGERQRVFIARALAANPKILILDEPSVGVDVVAQEQFYAFISKLNKEKNLTILFVTHDLEVVSKEVGNILCLNHKLVCKGKIEDTFTQKTLEELYGQKVALVKHNEHHHA